MASVTASRTGLERISLEFGIRRQLHHLGIFGGKKRSEARNPKLDMVWCAATLGLVVKTKQVIKDSNNVMLTIIKTCLK